MSTFWRRLGKNAKCCSWVAVLVLLEISGCATGDAKAGLGPNEDPLFALSVTATASTIEIGQSTVMRARGVTTSGQFVPVQVAWVASGGVLVPVSDSESQFSATLPGEYRVQANALASPSIAESAIVTVVASSSPTIGLSLFPASVSLYLGESRQFDVTATRQDASTYTPAVSYTATGGTINTNGLYTAGSTPGNFRVIATHQGGTLADTAPVVVQPVPPPGANPHEPAGMIGGFDEAWMLAPTSGGSHSGWWVEEYPSNVSVVDDSTSPMPDHRVLQLKFPGGFGGGNAPMVVGWNEDGQFASNTGTLYLRMRVKMSSNWSDNGNGIIKFFWPRTMPNTTNHYVPLNSEFDQGLRTGFNFQASFLGSKDDDNQELSSHPVGAWYDVEWLLYQGTTASANNGTIDVWVNGVHTLSVTGKKYLQNGSMLGWKWLEISPTFGGGSNPVPHDQYIWIDHFYASVK